MVPTGISEFSFGFAFLHEQANLHARNLTAAPFFPSLLEEKNLGYDAKLPVRGSPFFYQFKLSDYMKRSTARFWKYYKSPYYSIRLHKKDTNHQHNTLKKLSDRHPKTFYVAPEFHGHQEFNAAYLAKQVARNSRLIPLRLCTAYRTGKQHYISYQSGSRKWRQHSEVKEFENSFRGDEMESIYRSDEDNWQEINLDFAMNLYQGLLEDIKESYGSQIKEHPEDYRYIMLDYEKVSTKIALRHAANLATIFFGASLVVAGEGEQSIE